MTTTDTKAMEAARLEPCPFCAGAMMERHALWPSEGDTDSIIHAEPTDCPLTDFGLGTADEGASVRAAWNRRPVSPPRGEAAEAARELLAITQGDLSRIGLIYERLPAIQFVARAYLSTVSPPAEGEVREVVEAVRSRCLQHYQKLSRDAMLRQGDPVETIFQFVMAERNDAALRQQLLDALDFERERVRLSQPSAEEAQ